MRYRSPQLLVSSRFRNTTRDEWMVGSYHHSHTASMLPKTPRRILSGIAAAKDSSLTRVAHWPERPNGPARTKRLKPAWRVRMERSPRHGRKSTARGTEGPQTVAGNIRLGPRWSAGRSSAGHAKTGGSGQNMAARTRRRSHLPNRPGDPRSRVVAQCERGQHQPAQPELIEGCANSALAARALRDPS